MRPVVTPAEMAEADRRAIESGTPRAVLVERAGRAVARHALRMLGGAYGRRVVVVCGKGHNGADGRVAARVLRARGVGVDELALDGGIDPDRLTRAVRRADLAVDAMFGTGFRGVLEGDAAAVAAAFAANVPTLAVDVPSGVDGATGAVRGPAVRASSTVCFAALKPGLLFEPGRSLAGRVAVADVGVEVGEPAAGVPEPSDVFVPTRRAEAHKWSSGLMVVGGSRGMLGAPLLASRAAARCGAGMVVCGLPGADAAARASGGETVTRALEATPDGSLAADAARVVLEELPRYRAIAVGPGLGRDDGAQAAARRLVAEAAIPVVVDADALNALAADPAPLRVRHAAGLAPPVLTPHAGEYERLAGRPVGGDRVAAARDLAARTHSVVLLKGPGTVVADARGRVAINPTDSAALATAGTGDVLTGMIGAFLASGADPFTAAYSAAYVHGRAAHVAAAASALVASDLVEALPPTLLALRSGAGHWED